MHGHPAIIEVDLVIRDKEHVLVEVKASASRGDVTELWRIGKLYEKINGVRPRLVIITPYIDEKPRKQQGSWASRYTQARRYNEPSPVHVRVSPGLSCV